MPSVCWQNVSQEGEADWEVRVVLTALTWRYTQVKIKKEKAAAEETKQGHMNTQQR